jgi:hypothetical protein
MAYLSGNTGPIDYDALQTILDIFLETEPLVSHHALSGRLDSNPELNITLDEGFGSCASGRFDIVWTEHDCYNFHYTEQNGVDFRFDRHPEPHVPDKHFHEPPDATSQVSSCVEVEQVEIVTRAVIKCWRTALERDDPSLVNSRSNPP